MPIAFTVNGTRRQVDAPPDTPLLYVLRNDLEIGSPQFGCGLSQCGACSVLVDGKEVRACTMAVRSVADKQVTTIEGLPARWASQKGLPAADADKTLHPVQQAWIDEDVAQCGFCQPGQIMAAAALLAQNPHPTDADIDALENVCRCGTYVRIRAAIHRAAAS